MKSIFNSFIMAVSMFTIIKTPFIEWNDKDSKNMMKFYPLIGLIVGSIFAGIYFIMSFLKCSLILKSAVIMSVPFIISGMLHLDGYMDVCDAILSRRDKSEKLRILKDSKIGAFSVIALLILFFVQFGAVHSILEKNITSYSIIFIPVISRSLAGYFLLSKITIKESSLGTYFKKGTNKVDITIMIISIIISTILSMYFIKKELIFVSIAMIIGAKLSSDKCIKEFGGVSGDVAGFILVISECIGLVTLAII